MPLDKTRWAFLVLWMVGFMSQPVLGSSLYPVEGDSNFMVFNDRGFNDTNHYPVRTGDFNQDGFVDLVITEDVAPDYVLTVVFGPLSKSNRTSLDGDFTVRSDNAYICLAGDLNNDKIDDLIFFIWYRGISILFGKKDLKGEVNLRQTKGDVEFTISKPSENHHLAVGNFNGDEYTDLAILFPTEKACRILFGPSSFSKGTYDIGSILTQSVIQFSSPQFQFAHEGIYSRDMDGDGFDELVIMGLYDGGKGNVQIFRGRKSWPDLWDVPTPQADFTIHGDALSDLNALPGNPIGDFTGDGLSELLLVFRTHFPSLNKLLMVDGSFIALSTPTVITIQPGQPGASLTTPILPSHQNFLSLTTGDFDGDGRADLFVKGDLGIELNAVMSSDHPAGFPVQISTPSFGVYEAMYPFVEDMNQDGRGDLLFPYDNIFELPNGYASRAIFGFYGFRPLRHPRAVVTKVVSARWVDVNLSVERGDPTEMQFTGDVDASLNGQWVPFRRDYRVPLSSSAGPKTVQVTFRNEYKRTSDAVTFQAAVDTPSAEITPVTNRIRPGETAQWDLRVAQPTHVRARILLTTGEPLVEILNGHGDPGVVPLAWNGQNDAGHPVAPGVYVLVVDMDSQQFKTTVLVR